MGAVNVNLNPVPILGVDVPAYVVSFFHNDHTLAALF
jgi:hypothetical protein